MMQAKQFILPTADIVREFESYEWVFCFYQDGIRGLVRDTVLLSGGLPPHVQRLPPRDWPLQAEGLLERVVYDYEASVDLRYLENTYAHLHPASLVEMVVMSVDHSVSEMLESLFRTEAYEICKTRWRWLGDDLLTHIERHAP